MLTKIQMTYPEPPINVGDYNEERYANIIFRVCIDSNELSFEKVLFGNINFEELTIEDLDFIEKTNIFIKDKQKQKIVYGFEYTSAPF